MLVENKKINETLISESIFNQDMLFNNNMFNKNISNNLKIIQNLVDEIDKYNNNILSVNYKKSLNSFFLNRQNEEVKNYLNHNSTYEFIDLFSGAGGLSLGLEKSGLFPLLSLDKDTASLKTYSFNRPYLNNNQILNEDVNRQQKVD